MVSVRCLPRETILRCQDILPVVISAGLVACTICPVPTRARQAVTKTDLLTISEALKQFRSDGGAYPVTGSTLASFDSAIGNTLAERYYIREVPTEPWGGTFGYWSDGTHFILVSSGPNQRFDLEYGQVAGEEGGSQPDLLCGKMSPSNDDYVIADGTECPQDI